MFRRILIANRGEIACRIIETAQRLGVEAVAVFSEADAGARHVEMADLAVNIGAPAPAESYLRGDAIIEAAQESGAQAIHPGYGFLSENPDFVEAVEKAGLVFVGPSAEAIRAMGLKDAAKALMERAGVPVVPGWHGENQDDAHLADAAGAIGYPVLIKAVAGGGGKGMRLVERPADFADALASARAEAAAAFGNGAVLVEKFIEKPRHIEMQVFGDGRRAVHLFERDCSLQRRHQKVIEEAPAPAMTDEMRAAMGAAAVRAAEAIGYSGAGTVEFIVDGSDGLRPDRFWFMEMNTRLQVEHPVTEAITGIDLVEWQLRVAAGEELPLSQDEIAPSGHAIEARLYAEDVPAGFLPATGRLAHLRFGLGARIDTGVREGDAISPWYDPMIAKIITHGPTREIALSRLSRVLDGTEIAGTVTNLTFLRRLLESPDFVSADLDTHLIARHGTDLTAAVPASAACRAAAAVIAAGLDGAPDPLAGFTLWQGLEWAVKLLDGDEEFEAGIAIAGPGEIRATLPEGTVTFRHDGTRWRGPEGTLRGRRIGARVTVFGPRGGDFAIHDPLEVEAGPAQGGDVIAAPMPGLVCALLAAPGQAVGQGERLALLEAMKMEHTLRAPRDGIVAELLAEEGAQVEAGAPLIRLEAAP